LVAAKKEHKKRKLNSAVTSTANSNNGNVNETLVDMLSNASQQYYQIHSLINSSLPNVNAESLISSTQGSVQDAYSSSAVIVTSPVAVLSAANINSKPAKPSVPRTVHNDNTSTLDNTAGGTVHSFAATAAICCALM